MKISNFGEWISDNIGNITGIVVVGGVIIGLGMLLSTVPRFPKGTDVTVKGTEIHGTVTKIVGDNIEVSCVSKDGTVKSMTYNINLLTLTPR